MNDLYQKLIQFLSVYLIRIDVSTAFFLVCCKDCFDLFLTILRTEYHLKGDHPVLIHLLNIFANHFCYVGHSRVFGVELLLNIIRCYKFINIKFEENIIMLTDFIFSWLNIVVTMTVAFVFINIIITILSLFAPSQPLHCFLHSYHLHEKDNTFFLQ